MSRATIIGLVVLLVLGLTVAGGVLWRATEKESLSDVRIPAVTSAPDDVLVGYDAKTGSVLVGPAEAPTTIHVYEDFLCPACRRFEQRYGARLYDAVQAGEVKVRYHLVNLLEARSDPPGYSSRAANAAIAVAVHSASDFPDFHRSLFAAQPAEGSTGYSKAQLVSLSERLGATEPKVADAIDEAIDTGAYTEVIERALRKAKADPMLWRTDRNGHRSFAVPTVTVDGQLVENIRPGWLDAFTSARRPS